MLPSQLPEEGVIQIRSSEGIIEFHRYYGELRMIAKNANSTPGDCTGLQITATEAQCDAVYQDWFERVTNRAAGKYPAACDGIAIWEKDLFQAGNRARAINLADRD